MQNARSKRIRSVFMIALGVLSSFVWAPCSARAQFGPPAREGVDANAGPGGEGPAVKVPVKSPFPDPPGARRLDPHYPVWLDTNQKAVIVDGQVCLRDGMLEMFACTANTKEHEAIVAANTKAYLVHAGLLSLGAQQGTPVRFQPKYEPPTGSEIEVLIHWKDAKGKEQTARAQDWVKDMKTKKAMDYPFVFAGSSFWTDPENGKKFYQAEGGDFVCVSNFATAMLDIPVKSSQSNEELEFEAFTEKIPPLGAPVRLVFKPKLTGKAEGGVGKGEGKAEGKPSGDGESGAKAEGKAK